MLHEGSKVSYTGVDMAGHALGDQGRVMAVSDSVAHVAWDTGHLAGQVVPVYDYDLVSLSARHAVSDALEDSLEVGGLVSFSVRRTYDTGGATAVLNEMAESGHLASFSSIAEQALGQVAHAIRHDASFRAVSADLDEEEAENVLRLASACLIRDAFGDVD